MNKDKNKVLASYAPSFAHDDWKYSEQQTINSKKLLKKFSFISVRENKGVELISKYFGMNSIRVLDPTFLLEINDYLKLLKKNEINQNYNKRIIFSYIFENGIERTKIIKKNAAKYNLETISFCGLNNFFNLLKNNNRDYSVEAWLQSLRNSNLVITDSFHGMVFAIIFKKNFYVLLNEKNGSSRINSLLNDLGLESRIIDNLDLIKYNTNNIDWKPIDIRLKKLKLISANFLDKFFNQILKAEKNNN